MSDFVSDFWPIYIGAITVVSIVACAVLLQAMSSRRVRSRTRQTTGHVWDEDLGEYNNPLPRWWMWLFHITIVFSLGYLVLYPGLGSFEGAWKWTSRGQYEQEMKQANEQHGRVFSRFAGMDLKAVAADPAARAMGQRLFLNYCAQCHASDGGGSRGFPNLSDREWLYGGDPETIEKSIASGRNGQMPPWGPVLGAEGARDVAHFVMSLSGRTHDGIRAARGREKYAGICAACHGPQGKGNPQLGAPDLTDAVWLHGSSEEAIIEIVTRGVSNVMPAHADFLGPDKVRLLAAYVWGLSNPQPAAK